jgi:hypothetical protein
MPCKFDTYIFPITSCITRHYKNVMSGPKSNTAKILDNSYGCVKVRKSNNFFQRKEKTMKRTTILFFAIFWVFSCSPENIEYLKYLNEIEVKKADLESAKDCYPGWRDPNTGLCWQVFENTIKRYHSQAKTYCETISFDPDRQWRLPKIEELIEFSRSYKNHRCDLSYCEVSSQCNNFRDCYDIERCSGEYCSGAIEVPYKCFFPTQWLDKCKVLWSSTPASDDFGELGMYYFLDFTRASVGAISEKSKMIEVACVR